MRRVLVVLTTILVAFFTRPTLSLELKIRPPVVSPGEEVTVSCFDLETLKDVKVTFKNGQKFEWLTLYSDFSAFKDTSTLCYPLTESCSADRFGLLQNCGNSSGIQLRLRPQKNFGGIVRCEAKRNSTDEEKEASEELKFNWTPSVNVSGSYVVALGSRMNFTCQFKRGMNEDEKEKFQAKNDGWTVKRSNISDKFGIVSTTYSISKIAKENDNGTYVTCRIGKESKRIQIVVIDRSIHVSFKVPREPIQANISRNFSCGPAKVLNRPFVVIVTLKQQQSSVSIARVYHNSTFRNEFITADFFRSGLGGSKWQPITALPADSELQPLANEKEDQLQLSLLPWPRHNANKLICQINSTYNATGPIQRSISVTWKPSVQTVRLQSSSGLPIYSILENKSAIVNCTFQWGDAKANATDVIITELKGAVTKEIADVMPSWKDRRGFQWNSKLWNVTLRRNHNGKEITCKLAEQSASFTLNVTYPPRIIELSPASPSPPTAVGSRVYCAANANPPAKVGLRLRSSLGALFRRQEATNRAVIKVPICASEGSYQLLCEAENSSGKDKKNSTLSVRALSLPVSIKVVPSILSNGSRAHLSCLSESRNVAFLDVQIPSWNLSIVKNMNSNLSSASFKGEQFPNISMYPFKISKDIELTATEWNTIAVSLVIKPNLNGAEVVCQGKSRSEFNQTGKIRNFLTVQWPPSVRSVVVSEIGGRGNNVVEEKKSASVTCEGQTGSKKTENIRAKIDDDELDNPSFEELKKDASGFQWTRVTWNTSFSRLQDKAVVKCWVSTSSVKTNVRVHSKPYNTTIAFDEAELFVYCSSLGNPTPNINLTMLDDDSELIDSVTGLGNVSLALNDAVGNFSFVCVANNSIDQNEVVSSWARPAAVALEDVQVLLLLIVAVVLSGSLVLTLLLVSVVKKYSPRTAAPPNQELQEGGNENVLLDIQKKYTELPTAEY